MRCAAQPCRPPEVIPPSCLPASLTCAPLAGRSLGPGAPPAALGAMSIETLLEAARFLEWQAQQQQRARGERPGWAPGAPGKGRRATLISETAGGTLSWAAREAGQLKVPQKAAARGEVLGAVKLINEFINMQRGTRLLWAPPQLPATLCAPFVGAPFAWASGALGSAEDV